LRRHRASYQSLNRSGGRVICRVCHVCHAMRGPCASKLHCAVVSWTSKNNIVASFELELWFWGCGQPRRKGPKQLHGGSRYDVGGFACPWWAFVNMFVCRVRHRASRRCLVSGQPHGSGPVSQMMGGLHAAERHLLCLQVLFVCLFIYPARPSCGSCLPSEHPPRVSGVCSFLAYEVSSLVPPPSPAPTPAKGQEAGAQSIIDYRGLSPQSAAAM
jgi:hypothetical protein